MLPGAWASSLTCGKVPSSVSADGDIAIEYTREGEAMPEMLCFVPTSTDTVFSCSSRMMMGSDLDSVILGCVCVVWNVCVYTV